MSNKTTEVICEKYVILYRNKETGLLEKFDYGGWEKTKKELEEAIIKFNANSANSRIVEVVFDNDLAIEIAQITGRSKTIEHILAEIRDCESELSNIDSALCSLRSELQDLLK